jgi:hypothetical protein
MFVLAVVMFAAAAPHAVSQSMTLRLAQSTPIGRRSGRREDLALV